MLKSYLFTVVIGVVIATVALTPSNNAQTLSDNANKTILASVWDRPGESYSGNKKIAVYRSPSCSCCGLWVEHLKKHGFQITEIKTDDIESIKQKHNLPSNLASCHTAIIDGYVMEGHIPAADIKRFLQQKPKFVGLTVPGMPLGTPGMEAGDRKQPFAILAFNGGGEVEVFKYYENY
jgi:hypothetical protein